MGAAALALAGILLAAAAGCSTRGLNLYAPSRNADILFVVDDSPNTARLQENLVRNFPMFIQRLSDPSDLAGLANLHIAVVSTDMGAGDGSIAGCDANGGKNGAFQHAARGNCQATGLAAGATYISSVDGVTNYSGSLEDLFACIAPLGESGCRFQQPLAAAARALGADGQPPPVENQGFLRKEGFLFVFIVTNEDDCSAPPASGLFDTTANRTVTSPLGPPSTFRCHEFGDLCNGMKPPRVPPSGRASEIVSLDGCVSAEHQGMLTPVVTITDELRSLKLYPDDQLLVGAISGPSAPYFVHWTSAPGGPLASLAATCIASDGGSATPAVRVNQWVESFGANGVALSACADNLGPAFDRLAAIMNVED